MHEELEIPEFIRRDRIAKKNAERQSAAEIITMIFFALLTLGLVWAGYTTLVLAL